MDNTRLKWQCLKTQAALAEKIKIKTFTGARRLVVVNKDELLLEVGSAGSNPKLDSSMRNMWFPSPTVVFPF